MGIDAAGIPPKANFLDPSKRDLAIEAIRTAITPNDIDDEKCAPEDDARPSKSQQALIQEPSTGSTPLINACGTQSSTERARCTPSRKELFAGVAAVTIAVAAIFGMVYSQPD